MLSCNSERCLRKGFFLALAVLSIAAGLFYPYQNSAQAVGGGIALPKLLWLSVVLLCWYVIPYLMFQDWRLHAARVLHGLFLGNMLLRALIELYMMYGSHNWHPYYGIAHDIFSAVFAVILAQRIRLAWTMARLQRSWFLVVAVMCIVEAGFAYYMLHNVSTHAGVIFFVPAGSGHELILYVTWAVLLALTGYLIALIRNWLYASVTG